MVMIEYKRIKYGVDRDGIRTRYSLIRYHQGILMNNFSFRKRERKREKKSRRSHVYMQECHNFVVGKCHVTSM